MKFRTATIPAFLTVLAASFNVNTPTVSNQANNLQSLIQNVLSYTINDEEQHAALAFTLARTEGDNYYASRGVLCGSPSGSPYAILPPKGIN